MKMIKKLFNNLLFAGIGCLGLALIGFLLIVLVYSLPMSTADSETRLTRNTNTSIEWIDSLPGNLTQFEANTQIDRSSDRIMISIAGAPITTSSIKDAMSSNMLVTAKKTTYASDNWQESFEEYSRYWHGYSIFLRPLLWLFKIWEIYYLLMIVQVGLIICASMIAYKKRKSYIIPGLILVYSFWNPAATTVCLFFNTCVSLSLLGVILVLVFEDRLNTNKFILLFSLLGAATSFFDLLTYPLIVCLIPLIVVALNDKYCFKEKLYILFACAICWSFSYAFIWLLKWLLVWLICGMSISETALEAIQFRSSSQGLEKYIGISFSENRFIALGQEIVRLLQVAKNNLILVISLLIVVLLFVVCIVKLKKRSKEIRAALGCICYDLCLLVLLHLVLVVWLMVMVNHTMIHPWMTFRNLGSPLFALCCITFKYTFSLRSDLHNKIIQNQT